MKSQDVEVEHRGYVARQSSYNHHVWLSQNGEFVAHIQEDKALTEDGLRTLVDNHIKLLEVLDIL